MQKMSIEESIINLLINVIGRCSVKKALLKNSQKFLGKLQCRSLFLIKLQTSPATLLGVFRSYRSFPMNFCEIFNNIFFDRTPSVAASDV